MEFCTEEQGISREEAYLEVCMRTLQRPDGRLSILALVTRFWSVGRLLANLPPGLARRTTGIVRVRPEGSLYIVLDWG